LEPSSYSKIPGQAIPTRSFLFTDRPDRAMIGHRCGRRRGRPASGVLQHRQSCRTADRGQVESPAVCAVAVSARAAAASAGGAACRFHFPSGDSVRFDGRTSAVPSFAKGKVPATHPFEKDCVAILKKLKSCHSRGSGNPELIEKTGFRIALRLCGTTSELRHGLKRRMGGGFYRI